MFSSFILSAAGSSQIKSTNRKPLLLLFSHRRGFLYRVSFLGVSSIPVVRFLFMLRFEGKEKVKKFAVEVNHLLYQRKQQQVLRIIVFEISNSSMNHAGMSCQGCSLVSIGRTELVENVVDVIAHRNSFND